MRYVGYMDSPMGLVEIIANEQAIVAVEFVEWAVEEVVENAVVKEGKRQLAQYFEGKRTTFELPLELEGTVFRMKVWAALQQVPYGAHVSYQDIATAIGQPTAARAIGQANHHNPIAIIVPCHRVVGKNGSLVGYAGGLERKAKLLQMEKDFTKQAK
ncbi:MAG: methylated-DNA--[protein]-cysteine S-methyltransferase [Erysipelotrichaceae bacterium]